MPTTETAQQYIQRIMAHSEGKQPMAVQAATAKRLERSIKGVPTNKLKKRPAPNKWSVSEIVAHLADAEVAIGWRLRLILGAPGTPVAAFDQDAWVTNLHYEKRDPRKSVEQFRVLREANLALLKSLKPEQWKHYGMHAERGQETIEHIVQLIAGHDLNHLQQIDRILSQKKSN
jgi:DinB superfamily